MTDIDPAAVMAAHEGHHWHCGATRAIHREHCAVWLLAADLLKNRSTNRG